MPGPHKRTRSETTNTDENSTPTPTPTPRTTRRQAQAQAAAQAQGLTITPPSPSTPSRTVPSTPTPLQRTTSLFSSSARRTNNSSHNATPFAFGSSSFSTNASSSSGGGGGSGGPGTLLRTRSTPSVASTSRLKASFMSSAAGGGGAGEGDKGEGPSSGFGPGSRRHGRGKENVPPPPAPSQNGNGADGDQSSSRKRLRVNRSTRGRSGSVSSLRSETPSTSGRPSLGPSSSFSRITSRLPSPSPSTCSTAGPSLDSASITTSSLDAIDLSSVVGDDGLEEEMDVDKTPRKPRVETSYLGAGGLPTPPLSSPTEMTEAVKRMELIRMRSDASITSIDSDTRPANPYKHLKSFLRLSSASALTDADGDALDRVIVGRAHEKQVLQTYLSVRETDVGMYVSGPPGTGKTALVTAIGRETAARGWNMVEFGCMGLKPVDLWRRLGERLGCGPTETEIHSRLKHASTNTFIILDEIDSLLPPSPATVPAATSHLLSQLFALPLLSPSIKLVAISNTLDLTIRARLSLPDSRIPQVLPFKAYGAAEMGDIMLSRITSASLDRADDTTVKVDPKAVELLTRKVEAANGDLRNCLGCLTSAVSLAEVEWKKKSSGLASASVLVKVSLPHTIKAFNSHTQQLKAAAGSANSVITSATGKKVRSVPLQGKMVLVSILIYIARVRAGLPGVPTPTTSSASSTTTPIPTKPGDCLTTSNLFATYTTLLSHHTSPFPPSHESDYRDLLSNLEVLGLVSFSKKGSKVDLTVKEEEVKEALGCHTDKSSGLADDEVRRVWERESAKISSAMAKAERSAAVALLGEEL